MKTNDIWGTNNPQQVYDTTQAETAVINNERLIKLPSNKVMVESEFKIFDSILKSVPKTNVAIVPFQQQVVPVSQQVNPYQSTPTQQKSFEFQLNQKGIIGLALIFSGVFMSTLALTKIWGTSDAGQLAAYQERIDRQYHELGKRYDKLAKTTEKIGKKADICVSFYCGGGRNKDSEPQVINKTIPSVPASNISYNEDYEKALKEVRRWKQDGITEKDAKAFVNWIKENSSEYPISFLAMQDAVNELY